jgi:hypothetical protein
LASVLDCSFDYLFRFFWIVCALGYSLREHGAKSYVAAASEPINSTAIPIPAVVIVNRIDNALNGNKKR